MRALCILTAFCVVILLAKSGEFIFAALLFAFAVWEAVIRDTVAWCRWFWRELLAEQAGIRGALQAKSAGWSAGDYLGYHLTATVMVGGAVLFGLAAWFFVVVGVPVLLTSVEFLQAYGALLLGQWREGYGGP